jgi:hypothetical protein
MAHGTKTLLIMLSALLFGLPLGVGIASAEQIRIFSTEQGGYVMSEKVAPRCFKWVA